jgi:hypothetical protein
MAGSTRFSDAMALTPVGDGRYAGELNQHWTIGPKVHGGAMLALWANAARTEHGEGVEPISISGSFRWAPDPGPMEPDGSDGRPRGGHPRRARTPRHAAAVGHHGGAVDDAGPAAGARTDRPRRR